MNAEEEVSQPTFNDERRRVGNKKKILEYLKFLIALFKIIISVGFHIFTVMSDRFPSNKLGGAGG
jgi:hypothetical protein